MIYGGDRNGANTISTLIRCVGEADNGRFQFMPAEFAENQLASQRPQFETITILPSESWTRWWLNRCAGFINGCSAADIDSALLRPSGISV
jgi:hypothetical protein